MNISFAKLELPKSGAAAVLAFEDEELSGHLAILSKQSRGALAKALDSGPFTGKKGQMVEFLLPAGTKLSRLVVCGMGERKDLKALSFEALGGKLMSRLAKSGEKQVTVLLDPLELDDLNDAQAAAHVGYGALLRSYRFDRYRTKEKSEDKPTLNKVTIATASGAAARKRFATLRHVADGVFLTRDLVSEPANVLYPAEFADRAKELAELGVEVKVLGVKEMTRLGMGALLGVGQGSAHESKTVIMKWTGAGKQKPIAFIGKGVTFDTGGISIKPAGGMEDMKWDMGGAGTVTGLMHTLAARNAKVNVIGAIGLVENMPSGTAQRPGDVVTSMSGQTIEVINTDAEGRLVMADVLWYVQSKFKPKFMIDLATLTGAILVSLANEYGGLFSNDEELAEQLLAAGKAEGEELWRMPMGPAFDKMINSDIADMKNIGGRLGGSTTAAQFLERFVNKLPWAHLDIAGMAWTSKDHATVPKGGTGYGVRLLNRLVADHYER